MALCLDSQARVRSTTQPPDRITFHSLGIQLLLSYQFPLTPQPSGPDTLQNLTLHPAPEGPVDGAAVSQFSGQPVPLAAAAQPEYDTVRDSLGVNAPAPRGLGRVHFQNDRVNPFPQTAGNFPYCWQAQLVNRLAADSPGRRTPSYPECRFCPITQADCLERVEERPEAGVYVPTGTAIRLD